MFKKKNPSNIKIEYTQQIKVKSGDVIPTPTPRALKASSHCSLRRLQNLEQDAKGPLNLPTPPAPSQMTPHLT